MNRQFTITATIVIAATVLAGCASPAYYSPDVSQPDPVVSQPDAQPYSQPNPSSSQTYSRYGVVSSIQTMQTSDRSGNGNSLGAGAVLGGVVGGLIGSQVGGGRGKTVATVAGAIGGVLAGNEIEQRNNTQVRNLYQIGILLDDGTSQTITQDSISELHVGNRVRIDGDQLYRY